MFRKERQCYKSDWALNKTYSIELFSFPVTPERSSKPESTGLQHLAFEVEDIENAINYLENNNITAEPIRTDEMTGKRFTFFSDPDDLPLELYEK